MPQPFVHLHLHTEYSLVDGTIRVRQLVQKAVELGMPAVAVTDEFNLFALVKFYRAAEQAGIKPIVGADVLMLENDSSQLHRLTLLAMNRQGYLNLCQLISQAYLEGQVRGRPRLQREWVERASDGLIALSGGVEGDIGEALLNQHPNRARTLLRQWMKAFPDRFYLELRRTGRETEQRIEAVLLQLASDADCPVVASNDVRFLQAGDFKAHEARVCIHEGRLLSDKRQESRYSPEQYLKSPTEMAELFRDLPEALENAWEIAQRCNLELEFGRYHLPDFPTPEGLSVEEFLRQESLQGLEQRLQKHGLAEDFQRSDYDQRLDLELGVINSMGFPGYFLIVADFIRWAKEHDIPVGPGRGSGAGSLVAWVLGITDLDPLEHDLLFERFLNPERISMPDFDVDFCMVKRDQVIDYVANRYGRSQVSQIITFGTMAAKAVVRDCGRVLGHGYGFVDSIAKLIPMTLGINLQQALAEEPQLQKRYETEEETRAILDLAMSLEGLTRNAGKHAGGVVIAPTRLTDFSPLFCESSGDGVVTQFDKDDVETIGLVKFDFLGLRTLTIIDWAVKAINADRAARGEAALTLESMPMDDQGTFKLLQSCRTTAVFQLESRGMKDLIRKLVPGNFEDIVSLVALFRPGPLESGMVDDYIERKHGRTPVVYLHPKLEPILEPTYGVILYQEQVMQIAQVLAGYSLGAADLLRRAMGKKKPSEMAKQRLIFVDGATERGVEESLANQIFDQMETFAGYGFNKSHSAAYAVLSYQTAWLKAHHCAYFMAAVLSADLDNTDKLDDVLYECRDLGLKLLPPDINASKLMFEAVDQNTIRYGLGAIKSLGHAAVEMILQARENGSFRDLVDFCSRLDLQKINRRVIEVIVRSGAMDSLDPAGNRARLLHELPDAVQAAEQRSRDREAGQVDLFGQVEDLAEVRPDSHPDVPAWTELQCLEAERSALGLYLTGHPIDLHAKDLRSITSCSLDEIPRFATPEALARSRAGVNLTLAGRVRAVRRRIGQGGFVTLDNHRERLDLSISEAAWLEYAELLVKDEMLVVSGTIASDSAGGSYRMRVKELRTLSQAKGQHARGIQLSMRGPSEGLFQQLSDAFRPYRHGKDRVYIDYSNGRARARLELGEDWQVHACDELIAALTTLEAVNDARLVY